ncbi:MAG: cyclic nucleotide-binding domain-containing protein [Pseudomonadota bacterium]
MNTELKQALLQSSLCKYLGLNDLDMLMTYSKTIKYAPGDVVLAQGAVSTGTHIIIEGEAVVSAKVLGVGMINIIVLDKGSFIGEISQLLQSPSTVSVTAKTPLECFFISKGYFDMLGSLFPETKFKINKAVIEDVCLRQRSLHKKITAFLSRSQMASKSVLGGVLHALSRPKETTLTVVQMKSDTLQQMEIFNHMTKDQVDVLLKSSTVLDAPRNATVIREGEKTPVCYLVLRGAVQSSVRQINKIAKLSVLAPGNLFCCMSIVDGTPSIFDFTTCEHTILLKLSAENLAELKIQDITIWYMIHEEICKSFAALEHAASKLDIRLNSELYNR